MQLETKFDVCKSCNEKEINEEVCMKKNHLQTFTSNTDKFKCDLCAKEFLIKDGCFNC